jgi:anti-sigma-K factor RskA
MSSKTNNIPPRLEELMVDHATQGLSPQDEAELRAALASEPALRDEAEAYELAATAVELSLTRQSMEDLPPALREKLLAAAPKRSSATPTLSLSGTAADKPAPADKFSFTDGRMFGWYAAAAALVALAFVLALEPKQPAGTTPEPTLAEQYEDLADDTNTIAATWGFNADGGDPTYANATGEVIWNADEQTGYMKLAGLPVNDPSKIQYQLWIVDPARDAEPIDGGVFDITASGEVIVPIDAKLRSESPAVFAITVEQPGGVVVSEGPLQVVAAVQKS